MSEDDGIVASQIEGFEDRVLGVVMAWIVGGILMFRDATTGYLLLIQDQITGALESGGSAIADAAATVASVPLLILAAVEGALASIAALGGPLAPLIVVLLWGLVGVLIAMLIRFTIWLIPQVIPWL